MADPNQLRASGRTAGQEQAEDAAAEVDKPLQAEEPKPINLTRAFQRMRTDWHGKDKETIRSVKATVDEAIFEHFQEAYAILFEVYSIVRENEVDATTGEVVVDEFGYPVWKRTSDGGFIEDWTKLNARMRERILYKIITRLFDWEQTAADIWGEALFAKAQFEEAFATAFDTASLQNKDTVEARTARANKEAAQNRYLAVYKAVYSKRADAVVRSMNGLSQRLKDLHVT